MASLPNQHPGRLSALSSRPRRSRSFALRARSSVLSSVVFGIIKDEVFLRRRCACHRRSRHHGSARPADDQLAVRRQVTWGTYDGAYMRLLVLVLFSVVRMSGQSFSCLRLTSCVMSPEPIKFQWSGGTPPYYISLLPGMCQIDVRVTYAHACRILQLSRSLPHRYERPLELSILRLLTWRRFAI